MLLFKFFKIFLALSLVFSFGSACSGPGGRTGPGPTPFISEELKSEVPFSTKEPENFQAEVVVNSGGQERRIFIARQGANQRYDFSLGTEDQLTNLQTDKNYLILPEKKIYTENVPGERLVSSENWSDFLTAEWLSEKHDARFEKLETVDGLTKYRVRLGDSNMSEMLIYIDENLRLPVKQEFYSTGGDQRTLTFSVEFKNLKLEAPSDLFSIPQGYRKVPVEEFRRTLRGR